MDARCGEISGGRGDEFQLVWHGGLSIDRRGNSVQVPGYYDRENEQQLTRCAHEHPQDVGGLVEPRKAVEMGGGGGIGVSDLFYRTLVQMVLLVIGLRYP